jgi:hypothetical protein
MPEAVEYKTSIFVHSSRSIIYNDLTNRAYFGDEDDIALLARLADSPGTLESIASLPGIDELDERVEFFLREQLLVPASNDETFAFVPHRVDIETCRQCNARCQFCPQSVAPKGRGVMPLDLFSLILSRLEGTTPEWVAFNHYGEPLIDPFFRERVEMLRERNFPLGLYTNGTLLKDADIDFLAEGGVYKVVFNFPSLDPAEWSRLMHLPERSYWKARRAVEYYLTNGGKLPAGLSISVNGSDGSQEARARAINEHFSALGKVKVRLEYTNSRAGAIENELVQISSNSAGRLYGGCERLARHLHISWEGKIFLCCQDYDQKVVLGDLTRESIPAIMTSPAVRQLRAEMYGLAPMPEGRLCLDCHMLRRSRFPPAAKGGPPTDGSA